MTEIERTHRVAEAFRRRIVREPGGRSVSERLPEIRPRLRTIFPVLGFLWLARYGDAVFAGTGGDLLAVTGILGIVLAVAVFAGRRLNIRIVQRREPRSGSGGVASLRQYRR